MRSSGPAFLPPGCRVRRVTPDDQPYCGAELLPHATMGDGSPRPIVCTRQLHGQDTLHHADEPADMYWNWQDAAGGWLNRTAP